MCVHDSSCEAVLLNIFHFPLSSRQARSTVFDYFSNAVYGHVPVKKNPVLSTYGSFLIKIIINCVRYQEFAQVCS